MSKKLQAAESRTGQSMSTEGWESCLNSCMDQTVENTARPTKRFGLDLQIMWEPLEDVEKMSLEGHGHAEEGFGADKTK